MDTGLLGSGMKLDIENYLKLPELICRPRGPREGLQAQNTMSLDGVLALRLPLNLISSLIDFLYLELENLYDYYYCEDSPDIVVKRFLCVRYA